MELYRIELRYKTDLGEQWEGNGRWTEGESETCEGELQLAYADYEKSGCRRKINPLYHS